MEMIEVTDTQLAYLDQLRSELQEQVVGRYGTCRNCDALQFLIDNIDDDLDLSETFDTQALPGGDELHYEEDDSSTDGDGTADEPSDPEPADDDDMLNEMMNLLDTHDDKWEESPSGDYRYRVDLPDGGTKDAQTKDDVRAILFKEYR